MGLADHRLPLYRTTYAAFYAVRTGIRKKPPWWIAVQAVTTQLPARVSVWAMSLPPPLHSHDIITRCDDVRIRRHVDWLLFINGRTLPRGNNIITEVSGSSFIIIFFKQFLDLSFLFFVYNICICCHRHAAGPPSNFSLCHLSRYNIIYLPTEPPL